MKNLVILFSLIIALTFSACTENQRAKSFGGKAVIELPKGKKLINATWKDDNLWYLTRNMNKNDIPEEYIFSEKSSFGMMEGVYVIKEIK